MTRTPAAFAVEPLTVHDVVLIQPGAVLDARVSSDALAAWVTTLSDAATAAFRAHPSQLPTAGFVTVATRPDGRVAVWTEFQPALAPATDDDLVSRVTAVQAPAVKDGPVVVALRVSAWGARPPTGHAPAPAAWRAASRQAGHPLPLDELLAAVWPR